MSSAPINFQDAVIFQNSSTIKFFTKSTELTGLYDLNSQFLEQMLINLEIKIKIQLLREKRLYSFYA